METVKRLKNSKIARILGAILAFLVFCVFTSAFNGVLNIHAAKLSNFVAPNKWLSDFDTSHGWSNANSIRTAGDVNGDGKADLVAFANDGVYVALSTGTSFGAPAKWSSDFDASHGWTVSGYVRTVGDVNGDGMDDLIGFGADGVYIAKSSGTNFLGIQKWSDYFDDSHGWSVSNSTRTLGDANGDGHIDLIGFGSDGVYVGVHDCVTMSLDPAVQSTTQGTNHPAVVFILMNGTGQNTFIEKMTFTWDNYHAVNPSQIFDAFVYDDVLIDGTNHADSPVQWTGLTPSIHPGISVMSFEFSDVDGAWPGNVPASSFSLDVKFTNGCSLTSE